MSELDRRLEDLFAADARARRVRSVTVGAPARPPLVLAFAAAAAVVLLLALALPALLGQRGGVADPPLPAPSGSPMPSPTPSPCIDDTAVQTAIGGAKMGRHSSLMIDRVAGAQGAILWDVRFFVGPGEGGAAPGPVTVPLRVAIAGPEGDVAVHGYGAGQPGGTVEPVSDRLTVQPCRAVILRITTDPITDGVYTLTFPDLGLPEGGEETLSVPTQPLVCVAATDGATECDNPRGTRASPAPPTVRPTPATSPRAGFGLIAGEVGYPAGYRPELEVYAIDTSDPERWYSVTAPGFTGPDTGPATPPPPDTGKRYAIEVPPGTYHVVAYIADRARGTSPGLYSRYVLCGLRASCTDHTLIEVTVAAGEVRNGIDPVDWYYGPGTPYPPRPTPR